EQRLSARLPDLERRRWAAPRDGKWGLLLAAALRELGAAEAAERTFDQVGETADAVEDRAEALVGKAQVARGRGRLAAAIEALRRAAELVPARAREMYAEA